MELVGRQRTLLTGISTQTFLTSLHWRTGCWSNYYKSGPLIPIFEIVSFLQLQRGHIEDSYRVVPGSNIPEHNLIKFLQNFTSVLKSGMVQLHSKAPRGRMEVASLQVLREALHCVVIPCYPSDLSLVSLPCRASPGGDSENRLDVAPPSLILLP